MTQMTVSATSPPDTTRATSIRSSRPHERRGTRWGDQALVLAPLLAVLLVATIARLATVDTQSAWQDEGYSIAVAHHSIGDLVAFTARYDMHPILYYVVLHLWLGVVGFAVVPARLLSVICGVGSIAALYAVARALFDRTSALCAALVLALSPIAAWYATEARMYAMAGFFALLAVAFLLRASRRGVPALWAGYVVCGALAFYSDYSSAYLLSVTAAVALVVGWARPGFARRWLLAHIGLLALLSPALWILHGQTRDLAAIDWIPAPTLETVLGALATIVGQHSPAPVLVTLVGVGLAALGGWAVVADRRRMEMREGYLWVAALFLAPLGLPLLLSIAHPVFITQAVQMAVFGLSIFFARGIVMLWRWQRLAGVLALTCVLAVSGLSLQTVAATTIKEDWRGAAAYVHQQAAPGDVLIFDQRYLQLPFDLYWQRFGLSNVERGYPLDETLARASPQPLGTERELAAATTYARTVWVITRQPADTPLPADLVGAWLPRHFTLQGQHYFNGVSVYRFASPR